MRTTKYATAVALMAVLLAPALLLGACSSDSAADRMTRATKYVDNGKYRSAMIELKNVLQSQPKSAQAWFALGRISLAGGSYADAAHQLENARKYGTTHPQGERLLAQALIGERKFKQALKLLDPDAAGDAQSRAETHVLRGQAYLGLNQRNQAEQAFDAALQAQPDYPAARVGQARLAWGAGDKAYAQKLLADVIQANPSYARAWVVAGNLAYRQRHCDDVIRMFEHIQSLDAYALPPVQIFNARGHAAFCQLRQGQLEEAAANIDVLMKRGAQNPYANYLKGLLAYLNKNYDEATMHVQKALARAPDNLSSLILSGMIKTAQGDLKGAQLQFTNAVKQAPDSLRARQLLASVYMRRGVPDQAVKTLQQALDQHGSDPQVLAQLGAASVRAGQRAQGLQYLQHSASYAAGNAGMQMALVREMAQAGDNGSALALLQQVQVTGDRETLKFELLKIALYLRNKQPEKAVTEAQDLVRKHPDKVKFVRLLARVYAAAGQQAKARSTLEDALQTTPDSANLHLDLGRLAVARRDYQSANKIFHAVVDAHPDNVPAILALARDAVRQEHKAQATSWFEKAAQLQPDSIDIRVALTRAYMAQGEAKKALQVAKALVADAPDNARLYWVQAAVLTADGQHKAALASMNKAVSLAPDELKFHLDLARMLIAQKQFVAATSELHQIRDQYPDSLPAAVMLARTQLRQGQAEAALATADSLRADGKNVAASYALRAELLQQQGRYQAAATAYAKAYDQRPVRQLALSLFEVRRQGNLPHPEQSLQAWLRQHPGDPTVLAALAQWYQVAGEPKAAAKQYRALLTQYPENALALNNLALIYFGDGDERALGLAKKAHKAAPHNTAILDTLGWILVSKGNINGGLPLLQQAVQATAVPEIQYHLAVALAKSEKMGHQTKAKSVLTKLLASDKAFKGRADAAQLLQRLQQ